ncbi:hypothetical protein ACSO1_00050 [Acinetobacter calcoaceticus]|nr:hypothetical protein ACSO1_00050 [Acinetobacter calcoaceticus]
MLEIQSFGWIAILYLMQYRLRSYIKQIRIIINLKLITIIIRVNFCAELLLLCNKEQGSGRLKIWYSTLVIMEFSYVQSAL